MKIYTQKEAAKKFPERKYETYDPMVLAVGTRKEFQQVEIERIEKFALKNGKLTFRFRVKDTRFLEGRFWIDGSSLDIDRANDTRVVIWK